MSEKGYYYINCLYHALTFGIDHYAEETNKRQEFIDEYGHLIAGTMLVSIFAYLESTLGETWVKRCGGRQARELRCLKLVRDAYVHKNGYIRGLGSHTEEKEAELREFISDLSSGRVIDDKGNIYPCYMEINSEGFVKLNRNALPVIAGIGRAIEH